MLEAVRRGVRAVRIGPAGPVVLVDPQPGCTQAHRVPHAAARKTEQRGLVGRDRPRCRCFLDKAHRVVEAHQGCTIAGHQAEGDDAVQRYLTLHGVGSRDGGVLGFRSTQLARPAHRRAVQLHRHQAAGLVAHGAGAVALPAIDLGAALVAPERELARTLLDAGAVHRLDPPAAREHDDPLRGRVLVPLAHPADRLHGENDGRIAALHGVVPLRIGGADAVQLVAGERAGLEAADAVGIGVEVLVGHGRAGAGIGHSGTPVGLARGEGRIEKGLQAGTVGADHQQQEAGAQRQVLEEIPEQPARPSVGVGPEIAGLPERLEQHGGRKAVARDHEGRGPVGHAGDHAQAAHHLDRQAGQDHGARQPARPEHLLRLSHRMAEAQQLVGRAEGQKDQHHHAAHEEGHDDGGGHRRPFRMSATRSAFAMMVSVGFTAPIEGKKLASVT